VLAAGQALLTAIYLCGAIALFANAFHSAPKRWLAPALTIGAIFCISLDAHASAAELPLSLFRAAAFALAAWLIARYILDDNPLAWPLALFTGSAVQSALDMLGNHRADLQANGIALLAVVVLLIVFIAAPRGAYDEASF